MEDDVRIIKPVQELLPYIKYFWALETEGKIQVEQRIIPIGNIQLFFYRGRPSLTFLEDVQQLPAGVLCGHSMGYSDFAAIGSVRVIGVVFQPYGARAFFKIPMNEAAGFVIPLEEIGDSGMKDLSNRILETDDIDSCISYISQFLLKRLQPFRDYNGKRILSTIRLVEQSKGNISLSRLSENACVSYKQFCRIFAEHVGTNPKDFLRTVRFQYALQAMQGVRPLNFTRLALECGFYDQSHFIHEFRMFTGYTPKEYMEAFVPYSDYFSS